MESFIAVVELSPDEIAFEKTMNELNNHFIPNYTSFATLEEYFETYTITPQLLNAISTNTTIIAAKDDHMIPISDVIDRKEHCRNPKISFDIQQYGSHCAFLQDLDGSSWVDHRVLNFFGKH